MVKGLLLCKLVGFLFLTFEVNTGRRMHSVSYKFFPLTFAKIFLHEEHSTGYLVLLVDILGLPEL